MPSDTLHKLYENYFTPNSHGYKFVRNFYTKASDLFTIINTFKITLKGNDLIILNALDHRFFRISPAPCVLIIMCCV
jgi:hypothetical protein